MFLETTKSQTDIGNEWLDSWYKKLISFAAQKVIFEPNNSKPITPILFVEKQEKLKMAFKNVSLLRLLFLAKCCV